MIVAGDRYRVSRRKGSDDSPILALKGVTTREAAVALGGELLLVTESNSPLEEGEWLAADLVGCRDRGHRHRGARDRVAVLRRPGGQRRLADPADRRRRDRGRHRRPHGRGRLRLPGPRAAGREDRRLHAVPGLARLVPRPAPRGQRARARPLARRASTCAPPRPLQDGRVDDTPYGGGAGMVIRVDVVEAALEARWGADAVEGTGRPARGRAGPDRAPVRRRAGLRAGRRGRARAALRALRGLRRARARAPGHRRRLDRAVRAGRGRAGRDGRLRRRPAKAAGRAGPRGQRARGVVQPGAGGRPRVPALHAAGRVARLRRARGAHLRATTDGCANGGCSAAATVPPSGPDRAAGVDGRTFATIRRRARSPRRAPSQHA